MKSTFEQSPVYVQLQYEAKAGLITPARRKPHSPLTPPQAAPNARPVTEPVYGTCGHIARSKYHTCGSWACEGGY